MCHAPRRSVQLIAHIVYVGVGHTAHIAHTVQGGAPSELTGVWTRYSLLCGCLFARL